MAKRQIIINSIRINLEPLPDFTSSYVYTCIATYKRESKKLIILCKGVEYTYEDEEDY